MIDPFDSSTPMKCDAADAIPDEFIPLLSHDGKLRRQCSVAWQSGSAIGVRFLSARATSKEQTKWSQAPQEP